MGYSPAMTRILLPDEEWFFNHEAKDIILCHIGLGGWSVMSSRLLVAWEGNDTTIHRPRKGAIIDLVRFNRSKSTFIFLASRSRLSVTNWRSHKRGVVILFVSLWSFGIINVTDGVRFRMRLCFIVISIVRLSWSITFSTHYACVAVATLRSPRLSMIKMVSAFAGGRSTPVVALA